MSLIFTKSKVTEKTGQVRYKVNCHRGDFNLTFKCKEEATCQIPLVNKHWQHSFEASDGDYVFVAAQANKPHAKVDVKIIFKGKIFKKISSEGDYAMAIASGCLC